MNSTRHALSGVKGGVGVRGREVPLLEEGRRMVIF